jgi:hypothetical protein
LHGEGRSRRAGSALGAVGRGIKQQQLDLIAGPDEVVEPLEQACVRLYSARTTHLPVVQQMQTRRDLTEPGPEPFARSAASKTTT